MKLRIIEGERIENDERKEYERINNEIGDNSRMNEFINTLVGKNVNHFKVEWKSQRRRLV